MKRVITTSSRGGGGSNTNAPFRVFQSGVGITATDWRTVTCNGGYVSNLQHNLPAISGNLCYIIVPASATNYPIYTDTKITLYSATSGTIDHNTAGWPFYPDEGSTLYADMRGNAANTDNKAAHRCRVIAKITTSNDTVKSMTINQIAFSNMDISFPAISGSGCYTIF